MSGPTFAWAGRRRLPAVVASSASKRGRAMGRRWVRSRDDLHVRRHGRLDRGGEGNAVVDEHQARRQEADDRLELGEILGDQRIGRRDGRVGDARDHRAEAHQRMIDAVAGQDRDRPLDAEVPIDQGLRDCCAPPRAPRRRSPCATTRASALGSARNTRSGATARPMIEPVDHGAGIGAQRMGRARQHDAVRATLDDHLRGTEGQLRPGHPLFPPAPRPPFRGKITAVTTPGLVVATFAQTGASGCAIEAGRRSIGPDVRKAFA